jgi:1-acyl-sn-glycerol-3-phosphate acyltransferase
MKKWKRGFVKLALDRKLRVVPIAVQGLEESMPVAFTINFMKSQLGTRAGYPLFPIPFPSKIKLSFCKPIDLSLYAHETQDHPEILNRIADDVQCIVQNTLDNETFDRPLAKFSRFISQLRTPFLQHVSQAGAMGDLP